MWHDQTVTHSLYLGEHTYTPGCSKLIQYCSVISHGSHQTKRVTFLDIMTSKCYDNSMDYHDKIIILYLYI